MGESAQSIPELEGERHVTLQIAEQKPGEPGVSGPEAVDYVELILPPLNHASIVQRLAAPPAPQHAVDGFSISGPAVNGEVHGTGIEPSTEHMNVTLSWSE